MGMGEKVIRTGWLRDHLYFVTTCNGGDPAFGGICLKRLCDIRKEDWTIDGNDCLSIPLEPVYPTNFVIVLNDYDAYPDWLHLPFDNSRQIYFLGIYVDKASQVDGLFGDADIKARYQVDGMFGDDPPRVIVPYTTGLPEGLRARGGDIYKK